MAFAQRSSLRSSSPLIARSRLRSVKLAIMSTLFRSEASASSKVPRICRGAIMNGLPSTKSPSNIIFGLSFAWITENLCGRPKLDQPAEIEEGGVIRTTPGLLHIVRHDHKRVLVFLLMD